MNKSTSLAIGVHNSRLTMVISTLAVVMLVLIPISVVNTTSTTSNSAASPAKHTMSSDDGTGGRSVDQGPHTDRHADVIARYLADSLRQSQRR